LAKLFVLLRDHYKTGANVKQHAQHSPPLVSQKDISDRKYHSSHGSGRYQRRILL